MKLSILAVCVLFAGATAMAAPVSQGSTPKTPAHKAASEKPKMMWTSGSIEKYDASTKTLTVKHDGKELTFTLDDQTHVKRGKDALTTSALASGEHARIEYSMAGTSKSARVIELSAPKAAPAKK